MPKSYVKFAETEEEREAVFRLRYEINVQELGWRFEHENGRVRDENDDYGRLLIALTEDGEIIGSSRLLWGGDAPFSADYSEAFDLQRFAGLVPDERMIILDRLIIKPNHRKGFVFFQLIYELGEFMAAHRLQLAFLDCAPHLINLYQQAGFRTYAPTFNLKGIGIVVPMVCVLEDIEYMRELRSPLLSLYDRNYEFSPDVTRQILARIAQAEPTVEHARTTAIQRWIETYELLTQAEINRTSLFQNLTEADMRKILEKSHLIRCQAGETIILEGRDDRSIFAILSGQVEVRHNGILVATNTEGDVVGEISFLTQGRRTADVIAISEIVEVIALSDQNLKRLMGSDPQVAAQLMYNLAQIVSLKLIARLS